MGQLVAVLKILFANPINKGSRWASFLRFLRWQIGSWLVPGKVLVPWVNGSRIFAGYRMSGSAGCAYSGLHEFEEMAFVLHFLRDEDLFMDVGANVGVFTVLAAGVVGGRCVSVEPGDEASAHLKDNILINRMEDRVQVVKACISNENGSCSFAQTKESTWSHIAASGDHGDVSEMDTLKIDTILSGQVPAILKIDVEGYELQAVEGAAETLSSSGLQALILEIGVHSRRYGIEPEVIHEKILAHGFKPYSYEPFNRSLNPLSSFAESANTLYLRDVEMVKKRTDEARPFTVLGLEI